MAWTPIMGSTLYLGSWKRIQPQSLLIQFNDLVLIALRIYLLVGRKTTTSQGLLAGARKTGLLEEPLLPAPVQGRRALMWEGGPQRGGEVWRGRDQGPGTGVAALKALNKPAGVGAWSWGNTIWCDCFHGITSYSSDQQNRQAVNGTPYKSGFPDVAGAFITSCKGTPAREVAVL